MIDFPHINDVLSFDIDPIHKDEGWSAVRKAAHFLTKQGMYTLRSGLGMHVKSILVEPCYICRDYRSLYSNYLSKKFRPRPTYCNRLHFFNQKGISFAEAFRNPEKYVKSYLGFSVIQPIDGRGCLGRTFIDPMKVGNDPGSFYCLRTEYNATIMGADYKVEAYPYTAQSAEATVCAHSALWGVCRYLSERYNSYSEIFPYDLIQMTGNEHGRTVPYRGMTYTDYLGILSSFGCHPVCVRPQITQNPKKPNRKPNWRYDAESYCNIYTYVESGFPVLASLKNHVITLVGHTLRDEIPEHPWKDEHGWIDSFNLLKEFVVVDDNTFPYRKMGFRTEGTYYAERHIDDIRTAVIPLAEKVYLPAEMARPIAKEYLASKEVKVLIDGILENLGLSREPIITRFFLTSGSSFKRRKREFWLADGDSQSESAYSYLIRANLPHFVWVMEITPHALWKKRKCIGEVVIDATISIREKHAIFIRVGNDYFYPDEIRDGIRDRIELKKSGGSSTMPPKAFPMYTHNLGER